jgi:pimeloyl-ACP methyl ester carboxylesterase
MDVPGVPRPLVMTSSSGTDGLRLRDGRRLAYREYGAPDGAPVLFFHGWPGSRLDFAPNDAAAGDAGARVIAVDRPGIGGSDQRPGRKVLDWPEDVAQLADALEIEQFSVLGFSLGGPYARACAYALAQRVTRAGLISCLGPVDHRGSRRRMPAPTRHGLAAARIAPLLARPMVWFTARQARGGRMIDQLFKSMSAPDAEVLRRQDVRDGLSRSLAESFRQGTAAATWDGVAVARGEGFPLEDVRAQVVIWHGERDRNDPVAMARVQERRLPRVRAVYYPGEGHLIFFSRIAEILPDLLRQSIHA